MKTKIIATAEEHIGQCPQPSAVAQARQMNEKEGGTSWYVSTLPILAEVNPFPGGVQEFWLRDGNAWVTKSTMTI